MMPINFKSVKLNESPIEMFNNIKDQINSQEINSKELSKILKNKKELVNHIVNVMQMGRVLYYAFDGNKEDLLNLGNEIKILDAEMTKLCGEGWRNIEAISDFEYDLILNSLIDLSENGCNDIPKDLVGHVGFEFSKRIREQIRKVQRAPEDVKHINPMLSLKNGYDAYDIIDFILSTADIKVNVDSIKSKAINDNPESSEEEVLEAVVVKVEELTKDVEFAELMVENKFDGAAVEYVYENKKLIQASVRGDGKSGQSILNNVEYFEGVPLTIEDEELTVVTGEMLIKKDEFNALNERMKEAGEDLYSNPRNTASSFIKLLDGSNERLKKAVMSFFMYGVTGDQLDTFDSYSAKIEHMKEQGIHHEGMVCVRTPREAIETYFEMIDGRNDLGFEIDGAVIKVNNEEKRLSMGFTGHHPNGAMAAKFPPEIVRTKVTGYKITVGKTGALAFVAEIKPTAVGGVIVSNVTMHNAEYIRKKGIMVGCEIEVYRSGDVIPKFGKVLNSDRAVGIDIPTECPLCGCEVADKNPEKEGDGDDEGLLYCQNTECESRAVRKLTSLVARKYLDIEMFGEKLAEKVAVAPWYRGTADIWNITKEKLVAIADDVNGISADGSKIDTIIENIKKRADNLPLDKAIVSLQIPKMGDSMSTSLANHYGTFENFMTAAKAGKLAECEDVGPTISKYAANFFNDDREDSNINVFLKCIEGGKVTIKENTLDLSKMETKTVVLSGSLKTASLEQLNNAISQIHPELKFNDNDFEIISAKKETRIPSQSF